MVDPSKYLVFDVETNGLKAAEDDLLSISILKPDDGRVYNRLLPLEKQSSINPKAALVNGLTEEDLREKKPITQSELDELIASFEMDKRTILTFGGRGFDERFFKQYADDHGLVGLSECEFYDFKKRIHSSGSQLYPASKDNLCKAFGIGGVSEVHTSANDCRLEWELFARMDDAHLLVTGKHVYKLKPGYIYPASYIDSHSRLRDYAKIEKRYLTSETVFVHELSEKATSAAIKFPNNLTGNAFEHLLRSMLNSTEVDSRKKLLDNKAKLEYVGSFAGNAEIIYTDRRAGGAISLAASVYDAASETLSNLDGYDDLKQALLAAKESGRFTSSMTGTKGAWRQLNEIIAHGTPDHKELFTRLRDHGSLTDAISSVNETMKAEIPPLVDYLRSILGEDVLYQELVINENDGCLALCDFSTPKAIVEVKTGSQAADLSRFTNQLYYSSAGRDCYVAYIDWADPALSGTTGGARTRFVVDKVSFTRSRPRRAGGSTRYGKKTKIKHAVSDWRHEHPDVDNPALCARELWLDCSDVKSVWEKSIRISTNIAHEQLSDWEKSLIAKLISWRNENPAGSRIDARCETGLLMRRVEDWWFLAEPKDAPHGNEFIRSTVSAWSNEAQRLADNNYAFELWNEARLLAMQVGIPTAIDDKGIDWSNLFYGLNRTSTREKTREELTAIRNQCLSKLESGIIALRIPLTMTRYKTQQCFYELVAENSTLTYGEKSSPKAKPPIVIRISGRKAAEISARSKKIYTQALRHVGKTPTQIFIERPLYVWSEESFTNGYSRYLCRAKSELVIVFGPAQ